MDRRLPTSFQRAQARPRLRDTLPAAVMLDGDWCWSASPFIVTDETRTMVLDNICHVLSNFLR